MTKFKRVLSDDELQTITEELMWSSGDSIGFGVAVANAVQDATLAKLAEQEPVAWTSSKIFGHYATNDTKLSSEWLKETLDVPLYAHPCVTLVSDKQPCGSQNDKYGTQAADSPTKGMNLGERISHVGGSSQANLDSSNHFADAAKQEPIAWVFEDELPSNYPYELMFEYSKVDGVRMFPVYAPKYDGGSHD